MTVKSLVLLFLGIILLGETIALARKTKWHDLDETYTFDRYAREFDKTYQSKEEHVKRREIFSQNLVKILKHNADPHATWKAGVNHLTDLTHEEFSHSLGYRYNAKPDSSILTELEIPYKGPLSIDLATLPANVDWRDHGILTAVKDQGMCGSCWTFGTAETVESYWAKMYGELTDLSEQQILDCTPNPNDCGGQGGCEGGTPELAYSQIVKSGGLTSEWLYPYISYWGEDHTCYLNTTKQTPYAKLHGYVKLPNNTYSPIVNHIANEGPLAVNVDASTWQHYETGVYDGCDQKNPNIDHVVQLIGYGTDEKTRQEWWTVRNSWSPTWGEKGYIRLKRSINEGCGIDIYPGNGTGCTNGPPSVTVCGTCGIWFDTSYPLIA